MKVLITPHFNSAMLRIDTDAQKDASQLFSLASVLTREQLLKSPLLTKLNTSDEIYTLRGGRVRVFCTFDANGDLLFLDVAEAKDFPVPTPRSKKGEVTLFGRNGDPQAYIAHDDDNSLYSFAGEPLAYVDENSNIYGFNGVHLGWFEDEIVWDHAGRRVGFTAKTCPVLRKFEPFKGFKQFKPFKAFKQFAPFKPLKSQAFSREELIDFLHKGRS
jgi:hypothetical protein